jgi:hypothetical protein
LLFEADFDRRLWSTKEGVGETSGQTAGSYFSKEFAHFERPVRQKKQVFFVRCGSLLRNFTGNPSPVQSGPDVFADALVPQAGAMMPGASQISPFKNPVAQVFWSSRPDGRGVGLRCAMGRRRAR